jgi:SAM-dependent methyltransferase
MVSLNKYLQGETLYGDDFDDCQLRKWFEEEYNAFSDNLGDIKEYNYGYHAIDIICGFKFITGTNLNVLGLGSANGIEFLPIWHKIRELTILENSDKFIKILVDNKKIKYKIANYKGSIDYKDDTFDLIVSLSCLHYIANVSFVISEMTRCLKKGGIMLIREPIVSMGDWNNPRIGLTKNERGIPLKIFREIIKSNNLTLISEKLWNFRPLMKILFFYKKSLFNNIFLSQIDLILSKIFQFNIHYYPTSLFHRLAPSSVYYVLKK